MSCDDPAEAFLGAEDGALHTPCCSALRSGCPERGCGLGSGFLLSWGNPLRGLTRASESSVPRSPSLSKQGWAHPSVHHTQH